MRKLAYLIQVFIYLTLPNLAFAFGTKTSGVVEVDKTVNTTEAVLKAFGYIGITGAFIIVGVMILKKMQSAMQGIWPLVVGGTVIALGLTMTAYFGFNLQ